jgi:myo-inositol-1(or 4)-monophosphatase
MPATRLGALSEVALGVAREAAREVLRGWRTGVRASEKARSDLVTEYDLASERLIRARLGEHTPEIPVVGEEEGAGGTSSASIGPEQPVWFCDPIDGTTNFVHGHPFFAVSIGLVAGDTPLAGAVVAPALRMEWSGASGVGAWRDGAPCRVSTTERLRDALLATGFHPQGGAEMLEKNLKTLARVMPEVRGIRRCGAATLDLCMVADGTYDAFWERKLDAWDVAAGAAIVLAAGGTVTHLSGGPAKPRIGHVAVSNGKLHAALLALLAPEA